MSEILLTADIHLREDSPRCRDREEFQTALWRKFEFICKLAAGCSLWLDAGDIFHRAKPPIRLVNKALEYLRLKGDTPLLGVPGQHDLPSHDLQQVWDSAYGNLLANEHGGIRRMLRDEAWSYDGKANIYGAPWGRWHVPPPSADSVRSILVTHRLVLKDKPLWPGQTDPNASEFMNQNRFDLVLSGDNHQQFLHYEERPALVNSESVMGQQVLVNPGSMMRTRTDQIDHRPAVFLLDLDTWEVERVELPFKEGVIKRGLEVEAKADVPDVGDGPVDRDAARREMATQEFLRSLRGEYETGISVDEALRRAVEDLGPEEENLKRLLLRHMENLKGE